MTAGPRVGTTFAGYRIERVLGRGGMSVVYLAEHPRLKNAVALKLLAPGLAEDETFRERLIRESRLAASLNHPNVIPIYDTGEEDGVLFISMRYVDGPDLRTLLKDSAPLPAERTAAIVDQVAAALDAAHAGGLVHRDVKPANILLGSGDHVYLTDFGLSKRTGTDDTRTAQLVGTVNYVAPEQIRGHEVDSRSDIYALGAVLFQMLTGRVPFPADSEEAKMWAHLSEPPPRASELRPDLPRELDGTIIRAMAKDPEHRFAVAGDLAAAAAAALEERPAPVPAPVVSSAPPLRAAPVPF